MSKFFLRSASLDVAGFKYRTRISFQVDVVSTLMVGPSTQVSLFNLNDESRNRIEGKSIGQPMLLRAGYRDDIKSVFAGKVFYVSTERHGSDVVTTLHAMSGLDAFQWAVVSEGGILNDFDLFTAAMTELSKFGIGIGYISPKAKKALQDGTSKFPRSTHERAFSVLERLKAKHGLRGDLNFGVLNIVDASLDIVVPPTDINVGSGMLGSPTWTNNTTLKVKCFLDPTIFPRQVIRVKSIFGKTWTLPAIRVRHNGDTLEGPWDTDVEMVTAEGDPALTTPEPANATN